MGHFENRLKQEGKDLDRNSDLKGQRIEDTLISMKMKSGDIHAVFPDDEQTKIELIEDLQSDLPAKPAPVTATPNQPPKEVIFKNRQAWGDICVMTAAVRDFKAAFPNTEVGVITTAMHLWDHNPHINHQLKQGNVVEIGPGYLTNASNRTDLHFVNAFRISMEQKLNISIPQGLIKTDLWMTQDEIDRKPLIDGPYWVIVPNGAPGWPLKMYWAWEEVIDMLKDDIQIVQIGMKGQYKHIPGTIDYRGKTQDGTTGIRDVMNLFYNCEGSMGLVSAHAHIISSFGYPCVVVAGAREPAHFTHYQNHQYLSSDGCLPCAQTACWKCKSEGCTNLLKDNVPKCAKIIEPEEVVRAVRRYYAGGVLKYGKKRKRPTFNNVVKEAKIFVAPKPEAVDESLIGKFGFKWGGDSVTDKDWIFMKELFKEEKIKTVLEFGCGLSTLLMGTMVEKVISLGTMNDWNNKIKGMVNPKKHIIVHWDGKVVPLEVLSDYQYPDKYDIAFVDGPPGGENREWATKYASEHADLVIVHDAGRVPERKWQSKYLEKDFELVSKGGHRCHYWKRKTLIEPVPLIEELKDGKPTAKMVTTTRGYGGSERSTINIMQMLLDRGYNVELVSTSNVSGEYGRNIPKGVMVSTDFAERVTGPCDLMILYASDTIWSYNKAPYTTAMPYVQAKRKVMVLNFKLGGAGKVEWTKGWDKYLFLNSSHEAELIQRMPGITTTVMAPPTNLDLFFNNTVDYSMPLKLIRHNSQGDNKHHPDTDSMIRDILRLSSDIEFHYMPSYSKCMDHPQIYKYPKNKPPVWDFLRKGNCFWYRLPDGYSEGGPRTILEAQASGLAVIADNHSGPKDRVTEETGWLCDNWNDYLEVIKYVINNPNSIMEKGIAAKKHAKKMYIAERWIGEIIGDN